MSLRIHDFAIAFSAQMVRLVLAEKGLEYETRLVDPMISENLGEAYLKINPDGVVPTLEHDGVIITNSSAIAEYIDDAFPQPALSPSDKVARAHMRAWMRFFEDVTAPAVRWPSWQRFFFPMLKPLLGMERFREMAAHPHLAHFYNRLGEDGFPPELVAEAEEDLMRTFVRMNKALADGRNFLVNDLTLADLVVLPLIVRAEDIGLHVLWSDLPFFVKWFGRMQARPSFGEVFSVAGVRLPQGA
jgi:glutathione S-transferase